MNARTALSAIVMALFGLLAPAAHGQTPECPCNCYFSGDCESGNFCYWGSIPEEDSCFWRTPKPQGNVGAGCDAEYNNWGQCDGICTENLALMYFSTEAVEDLVDGLTLWADAMAGAGQAGGGYPVGDLVAQAKSVDFQHPGMADSMWRIAHEVFLLSGAEMVYPDAEQFHSEQVRVADLSSKPEVLRMYDLAMQTLVAEIHADGAGARFIDEAAADGLESSLDETTYGLVCRGEPSKLDCLYTRLLDMATVLARSGRDGATTLGGAGCAGLQCEGDVTGDGVVDVTDMTKVIQAWGPAGPDTPADINGDGGVGVPDLVLVVQNWGPCE